MKKNNQYDICEAGENKIRWQKMKEQAMYLIWTKILWTRAHRYSLAYNQTGWDQQFSGNDSSNNDQNS